jgi:hypothetical protein
MVEESWMPREIGVCSNHVTANAGMLRRPLPSRICDSRRIVVTHWRP